VTLQRSREAVIVAGMAAGHRSHRGLQCGVSQHGGDGRVEAGNGRRLRRDSANGPGVLVLVGDPGGVGLLAPGDRLVTPGPDLVGGAVPGVIGNDPCDDRVERGNVRDRCGQLPGRGPGDT